MKLNRGNFEANLYFINKYKLLDKSKNILEIGSGTGNTLNYLRACGYKVQGCEANDSYIRFAKQEFGINLKKVTTTKLPYKDNSFDLVVSFDVLEHIPNTKLHLKEVNRILKKGGKYIFSTPNKVLDVPFEIIYLKSFTKYKKHHCSLQNYWSLRKLLKETKFNYNFYDIPVKTKFMLNKVRNIFGNLVYQILLLLPIDSLPISLKTNFYVVAEKK